MLPIPSLLFALSALEGLIAVLYLAFLPADAENAFLFGFSTRRLLVMAVLATAAGVCAVMALLAARPTFRARFFDSARRRRLFNALFLFFPGLALFSGLVPFILYSIYRASGDFRYFAYYQRLLPLFIWLGLFAVQAFLYVAWSGDFSWRTLRHQRPVFRAALVALVLFLLAWLFVALTGIGRIPDVIGWGSPSVPLLEWQIALVWLAGTILLLSFGTRRAPKHLDAWIAGALWVLAAGLWLSQPVHTGFFATAGRPPNNEIYPFSDGAYYGLFAQNVLIGNGYQGSEVPPRPDYIALLALFHALVGQSYARVIFVQTLLLAFLPVVLYFIGKELHSRPVGLAVAQLAILRELNAIFTVRITDKASTSQLFFADLPSALVIALWALVALIWLKRLARRAADRRATYTLAVLVGAAMGLSMLFRTQSVFMLPGILLLAFLASGGRWWVWVAQSALVALGLILVVAPWLGRNYLITGSFAFDDPKSQTGVMAQRYNAENPDQSNQFVAHPGEDLQAFSKRVNQGIFSYMLANPGEVTRFVAGHLLNNQICNLLMLPVRDQLDGAGELLMPTRAFWQSWQGAPSAGQSALMLINLGLLALGMGGAWARGRWGGLALLVMNVSYNASNALARNSGLRYLLPIDWTVYTYAAVGLLELSISAALILGRPWECLNTPEFETQNLPPARRPFSWRRAGALGAALLLLGAFPVIMEHAFPRRYPLQTTGQLVQRIQTLPSLNGVDLAAFAAQPNARVIEGRALYPRFYAAGDGEPRTAKAGYEPLDYARTVLLVASNTYNGMVLLPGETAPASLPNASDVIVLGCAVPRGYVEAQAVLVIDSPGGVYWSAGGLGRLQDCPAAK